MAVFFAGGEAMLFTPFRAGSAHVVQLGVIGIKNPRRPFRDHRAETVPDFAREGADERQFSGDSGTWCHHLESHLFPPAVLAGGNLDAFSLWIAVTAGAHVAENQRCDDYATKSSLFRRFSAPILALHHEKRGRQSRRAPSNVSSQLRNGGAVGRRTRGPL
jgi:hypothetical protein